MSDVGRNHGGSPILSLSKQLDEVVDRGGTLWRELHGKSILLTGGTGFLGRWLLESLVRAQSSLGFDLDVVLLTRNIEAFRAKAPHLAASPHIELCQGDISSFVAPRTAFSYVIHAAATSAKEAFNGADPLTKFQSAVDGTRRVLDVAVASGESRVLILGSGSVYGPLSEADGAVSESYRGAPSTFDIEAGPGHGRRAAEFLCACYGSRHDLSVTVARCFAFVGPYLPLNLQYAIGNFIRDALYADEIIVSSDGRPVRTYLFAGDLVVWLLVLLLRGQPNRAYNVGSDRPISLGELAQLVGDLIAPGKSVRIMGQVAPGQRSFYVPDISLARREFGLDVWTSLENSIRQTAHAALLEPWGDS